MLEFRSVCQEMEMGISFPFSEKCNDHSGQEQIVMAQKYQVPSRKRNRKFTRGV
jgi:hypothetical protein